MKGNTIFSMRIEFIGISKNVIMINSFIVLPQWIFLAVLFPKLMTPGKSWKQLGIMNEE